MFFKLFLPQSVLAHWHDCTCLRQTGVYQAAPSLPSACNKFPRVRSDLGFVWRVGAVTNRLDGWWVDDRGKPYAGPPLPPHQEREGQIQAALAQGAIWAVVVVT